MPHTYNSLRITYQSLEQFAKDLYDQVRLKHYQMLELESLLYALAKNINRDKDGSYFIPAENKRLVETILNKYCTEENEKVS